MMTSNSKLFARTPPNPRPSRCDRLALPGTGRTARIVLAAIVSLGLFACKSSVSNPKEDASALEAAERAATLLASTLRVRLVAEMQRGGPPAAVKVCAEEAGKISEDVARQSGVRIGRSSLRLRNPQNAPSPWVQAWLTSQGERAAAGVAGFSRVEDSPAGRVARVLRPIAIEAPCLACHGPASAIAAPVGTLLKERYPQDRAIGYAAGDLRGALWAEVRVGSKKK
jgi:hypothetical protein